MTGEMKTFRGREEGDEDAREQLIWPGRCRGESERDSAGRRDGIKEIEMKE